MVTAKCGRSVQATSIVGELIYRGYARLQRGIESPFRMVFRSMMNLVLDRVRREKVAEEHRKRVAGRPRSEDPVGDEVRHSETARIVEQALAEMPTAYREVWEYRQRGMSHEEIAVFLNKEIDAVKQTYSRCLKKLRAALSASSRSGAHA